MKHKRRSYLGSLADAFRVGYNRNSYGSPSFVVRHDAQYHRNKHRKHAAKNAWHTILGVVVIFVVLICICGSCI